MRTVRAGALAVSVEVDVRDGPPEHARRDEDRQVVGEQEAPDVGVGDEQTAWTPPASRVVALVLDVQIAGRAPLVVGFDLGAPMVEAVENRAHTLLALAAALAASAIDVVSGAHRSHQTTRASRPKMTTADGNGAPASAPPKRSRPRRKRTSP